MENRVSFTGKVKSSIDAKPQFNSDTGEVVWKIDNLRDQMPQAVFQIEAVPSVSMVGQYMPLLGTTEVRAIDNFTGLEIRDSAPPLTTRLRSDATVKENEGLVTK